MKERGQRKMFSCQKHFSKVNPVQNDNNNNKIVVKKFKRASSSASNLSGNEEGAMTLEASLIVPIFDRSFDAYKCRRDFDDPPTDFSWCL